ncbi:MAG: VTT domain-containing protein [Gammaproteobacteria bacterium]|jgi:phosphatidylserine/phosphatidylglycerophosphate/cardiolipin synthase-like enzyme/uncharacterized membrane protein YdjX (TVP38/TMEM64 family)
MSNLLASGSNCDRIVTAERVRFLVDGENYFHTLRDAIKRAQRAVYILSWDIDSNVLLERSSTNDGYPARLGEFLDAVAAEKPELNIYILNWDFAVLFALDRELLPIYKLDWKSHDRVHFRLDNQLPDGASQHQKVVVIDDALAFVGGLDLTKGRWDTNDHLPNNKKRDVIGKKIARPYHDVQTMLAGDCARELGAMARDNWLKATGQQLPTIEPGNIAQLWPDDVNVDIRQIPVAIAYTYAQFKQRPQTRQIQQLYTDAIASAKKFIYLENQYFTTPAVGDALRAQLKKTDGPEIVLVTPKVTEGWLSQHTMDVLRVRLVNKLKRADKHNRLRVYYPDGRGLDENPINVHAKLMVVDDQLTTVGSANLNNRSMALDNECNIAIHATDNPDAQQALAGFRNRLLAEHLGCQQSQFEAVLEEKDSLIATIDSLNHDRTRHLSELPLKLPKDVDQYVPDTEIVDPEHPIEMDKLINTLIPEEEHVPARKRILTWVAVVTVVFTLAGIWHWTPLQQWVNLDTIAAAIDRIRTLPGAPLLIIAGFVIAGLVAFPFTVLIVASVIAFGSLAGFIYALVGGTLSAVASYGIGHIAGRGTVRKLAGERLNRISKKLARHGILTIVTVRIVPVAPFTIINLVAGASHIKFRDYFVGTMLGMAPGMLAITILVDRVNATITQPSLTNASILAVAMGLVVIAAFILVKWLMRRSREQDLPIGQSRTE